MTPTTYIETVARCLSLGCLYEWEPGEYYPWSGCPKCGRLPVEIRVEERAVVEQMRLEI